MLVTRERWEDLDELELAQQVQTRRQLIREMVGTLYPRILANEIQELMELADRRARTVRAMHELIREASV